MSGLAAAPGQRAVLTARRLPEFLGLEVFHRWSCGPISPVMLCHRRTDTTENVLVAIEEDFHYAQQP
jgi:hypothetical protein